ncbi:radical SAM family heme chaperone HemW [Eubacterium sp. An11]|uniref:radical SAM family heme chaperone HemW n=1 Tax=Eubacterium sp. An11 TaxID=1965542 RepID=UPI001FA87E55|nr:radical SAM family heme chaperone HemW [Eubacterium sp. An11]
MLELYIHIPFCVRKCNYCDFLSFPAGKEIVERYVRALEEEIRRTGEAVYGQNGRPGETVYGQNGRPEEAVYGRAGGGKTEVRPGSAPKISTVFVGGGTPSVLEPEQIRSLFSCLRESFLLEADAEISMEANPGTLNREKLSACREEGINRLSLGLQSADDGLLQTLGRIHTWEQFLYNYQDARQAGFRNINIDLMSSLPGQSLENYVKTLETVTALEPEHISSYSLILEEGTPFFASEEIRRQLPDENTDREMYEKTKEILHEKGYERYEISNYAKPGFACRHNLGYWDEVPYLGLGLGASSYYKNARFSNETDIRTYMENPFVPFLGRNDYECCDEKSRMEDYMIFGLRKMAGVSLSRFEKEFGTAAEEIYGGVIDRYVGMGLLVLEGDRLRLTDAGIDVSNRIFEDFLLME